MMQYYNTLFKAWSLKIVELLQLLQNYTHLTMAEMEVDEAPLQVRSTGANPHVGV